MKKTLFAVAILSRPGTSCPRRSRPRRDRQARRCRHVGLREARRHHLFAVDPAHPRNSVVVDLDKAKKDGLGRVEFSADLYILQPKDPSRRNGVALVEVSNRGGKGLLSGFARASASRDPATNNHLGDGFLTEQGYTLVWVGWQFDVAGEDAIKLHAPVAAGTSGVVRADFTPNERQTEAVFVDLSGYTPADVAAADTTLTVRDGAYGKPDVLPRTQWQLRGNTVTVAAGLEPGRTYQLSYRVRDLPVAGSGLVAYRDTASWLKRLNPTPPLACVTRTRSAHRSRGGSSGPSSTTDSTATRRTGWCTTGSWRISPVRDAYRSTSAARTLTPRWANRRGAARQHANLLSHRHAALAWTISAETNHRAATRQSRAVLVDASCPAHRDGSLGAGRHAASGEPISEVERRHARPPRNSRVSGNSWRSVAADSSARAARLYSPFRSWCHRSMKTATSERESGRLSRPSRSQRMPVGTSEAPRLARRRNWYR